MESDTYSNTTVFYTVSHFNNSDIETPDKFDNSEPSSSTFSQPPSQPLHSQLKFEPPSLLSSNSNVTPTCSPLISDPSDNNSSVKKTQISHELDNFCHTSATNTAPSYTNHSPTLTIYNIIDSINANLLQITPLRHTQLPHQIHPHLVQTEPIEPSKRNSPILHFSPTQEQPKHLLITHSTITLKNSFQYIHPFPPIHLLSFRP